MAHLVKVIATMTGWEGAPGYGVHYFTPSTPNQIPSPTDVTACLAGVRAAYANAMNLYPAFMRISFSPVIDIISDFNGSLQNTLNGTPVADVEGDAGAVSLPSHTAICVNFITDTVLNGRKVRGRTFLGPLRELGTEGNGTPTTGMQTQATEFAQDLRTVGGMVHVIWHRPSGPSTTDGQACMVISERVKDRFAILRSRRA